MSQMIQNIKALGARYLIQLMKWMPIKRNKVFMMSYYGKGYDCNPKYLTEYLVKHKDKYDWDIVWAFDNPQEHKNIQGIRKVRVMSLRYFYELYTAQVIVTNFRMTKQFYKRKGQYYIQTWHSSLRLKQIEKDAEASLPTDYVKMAQSDSKQCDLLISGCAYSTQIFKRAFWYDGPILECGTPRNDYLSQQDVHQQEAIKKKIGINPNQKVVLYAPTFRKGHDLSVYDLDYRQLREVLTEKWGGDWVVLIRLHPHLNSDDLQIIWSEAIRDGSKWEDIQELLAITDVLISDYSSLMFDFSFTKRPCFLYVPDLVSYIANDRGLYFDIEQLPFEMAPDRETLNEKIRRFEDKNYQDKLESFNTQIGSFEQGDACKQLAEHMARVMNK